MSDLLATVGLVSSLATPLQVLDSPAAGDAAKLERSVPHVTSAASEAERAVTSGGRELALPGLVVLAAAGLIGRLLSGGAAAASQ